MLIKPDLSAFYLIEKIELPPLPPNYRPPNYGLLYEGQGNA